MMAGPGRQIERFRCSYGLNHEYLEVLTANGLRFSGSGDTGPVRIAERPGHPFFPRAPWSSPNGTATAPAGTRSSPPLPSRRLSTPPRQPAGLPRGLGSPASPLTAYL